MALHNLGNSQMTPEEIDAVKVALTALEGKLSPLTVSLQPKDRQKFGSINEQNKLLVNRVADFYNNQPALASPRVDWAEFQVDYNLRKEYESLDNRLQALSRKINNAKILHDYDNYQASIEDYNYTAYSMKSDAGAYEEKYQELKQFFPRSGGTDSPQTPDTPTPENP